MGKTEIIILIFAILFVGAFVVIYLENSKKIKAEKESQSEKPAEKPEAKKPEVSKSDAKSEKAEQKAEQNKQKQLEKAQEEAKKELRSVMEEISIKSENYIKSLEQQDEQNAKKSKFEMKEVSQYEVGRDEAAEEAAIILGVKQKHVHVFDNCDECRDNTHETASSILHQMNEEELNNSNSNSSPYTQVSIDSFEEDESVAEEFTNLSKRMKVMMVADVFKKKSDDENQE